MNRNIVIFDGSFKTTPFINRLCHGLSERNRVYILGFNERISEKLPGVHYVSLGSNQHKIRFVTTTLAMLLKSKKFSLLFPTLAALLQGKRKRLQQQNLHLALQHIKPDLIHLQWPSVIPWFETILRKQNIPVILSQRGFHSNVRPFVDAQNRAYLEQWYPKMAGFHSVSKAIARKGDKIWNAPEKIDQVVYTGLLLEQLPFNPQYSHTSQLQLVSVGRSHWIKGYAYALAACKILKDAGVSFRYTIIGGAGDEELQYLVHELELNEQVHLEGKLPQEHVFKRMQQASLLLMPSIDEGIPNVVVEAMALGLPVLSTNCGGVTELITHRKHGWIVPIRAPKAMADQIKDFMVLPEATIQKIRTAARQKVADQHSETRMVNDMERLYELVITAP